MAKQGGKVLNLVAWLTGVLVSLAVGFGMVNETLAVPYIGTLVNIVVGYVVVVTTVISAILAILKQ